MIQANHKPKPAFGVSEWADKSVNIQSGCERNCKYCYAKKMAIQYGRKTAINWHKCPEIRTDVANRRRKKVRKKTRVMFPTSHDITRRNLRESIQVCKNLLSAGNDLLIVSKPDFVCVEKLCQELSGYKDQILFRFTIGSTDNKTLRYWEPGASTFEERLKCLKHAYEAGFKTSVSAEPMLDTNPDAVVNAVKPYLTDAIWLGRVNGLRAAVSMNCKGEAKAEAERLLSSQPDSWLVELYNRFKDDPQVKFKDSIKVAVGLPRPTQKGLDV